MVDDFDATLVQGTSQIKSKDVDDDSIPSFPDEIANGVTSNAELIYNAAKLNGTSLKFTISIDDDNYDLNFNNYVFTIPTK